MAADASCWTSAETGRRKREEGKGAPGAGEGAEREGQGAGAGEGAPRPGEGEGEGAGEGQGAGTGAGPRTGEDQGAGEGAGTGAQPRHQGGPQQVKVSGAPLAGALLRISISDADLCRERAREDKKRDRDEDEEDVYERRRLERRLRDKEAAYQEVCEGGGASVSGSWEVTLIFSLFSNLEEAQKLGDPGEEEVP